MIKIIDPRARSVLQKSVRLLDGSKTELPMFYEAEAVVSRLEHLDAGFRLAFHSLENYINAMTIQADRLDDDQAEASDLYVRAEEMGDHDAQLAADIRVAMIFIDVHFYFICLDKFVKLFKLSCDLLARLARGAPDPNLIRTKRKLAFAAFRGGIPKLR